MMMGCGCLQEGAACLQVWLYKGKKVAHPPPSAEGLLLRLRRGSAGCLRPAVD